ncbi:Uncharacterised protein [Achromobacter xylosoxidans]|nr:Uncharacterised protein [Achromobacter xylosoxidans]
MQVFLGQAVGQLLEHGLRRFAARQQAAGAFEFGGADVFGGLVQVADDGHHFARLHPVHEALDAGFDDGLGLHHGGAAGVGAGLDQAAQVIDGIQVDVVQAADLGFDVARHGQVDHHHGTVAAQARGPFHHPQTEDGQGAGRTGDHHVEFGQALGQVRQLHGAGREPVGQQLGALGRAIGHHHAARTLRGEVGGAQLDHFARADEQRAGLVQVAEHAFGQAHRGGGHGHRLRADGGLRTDFLGHREGALEHLVQQRAERTGFASRAHGVLHLADDLGFAQHHGIEPAGHAEGVAHGVVLLVAVQMRAQRAGIEPVVLGQPRGQLVGHVAIGGAIDFGAVAGRQDGGFAHRPAERGTQAFQRRLDQIDGHGHAFADRNRRGRVIQTEG